jgi:xanthine dehydrogenase molybdenum-binding subunit
MLLYRECPNVHYQAYVTYTNLPASGAYRGFGDAECQFAMECAIDEVAEQLHVDPIEFRLKNTIKSGAELLPMFPGQFISSVGLEECLRRGAAHIGWHRRRAPNADGGPLKRGLGCATSMHTGGHLVPATARVQLSSTGEVQVISPLPDIGSGHQTAARQIVAETLNMDAHDARVRWGDTEATDEDFGIHGSRGTFMIGRCLDIAARQVDQQLRDLAAEWLGFAPQELRVQDTQVVAPNGRSLSFGELAAMADRAGQTIQGVGRLEETDAVWGFAAHFAEVEVDTDTGDVKVVRLVAAADVGRAINPLIVEGQLEGAAIQGIGYALSEELVYDPVIRGTLLNPNLLMYELPTIRDVPLVETVIVESDETMHPYGAKGCGETGLVGVAPSIANAIYNATGIRFADLPITPAKILPALESARPPDSP